MSLFVTAFRSVVHFESLSSLTNIFFYFFLQGVRLKTELDWQKGDTLFKSRTEFSMNQDPNNILTAQTELLKDDNSKYTLTMAVMHPKSNLNLLTTFRMFELNNKLTASMDMKYGNQNANWMAYLDKNNNEVSMQVMFNKVSSTTVIFSDAKICFRKIFR